MAALNLNMLTENASRLGMRLQETLSEHTRDLAIARGTGSAYLDNPEEKVKNIAKQLDSNSDREKLEAMKRLIAVRVNASVDTPPSHSAVVDLTGPQRLGVLRASREERRVAQPGDPQARLHLPPPLCRAGTRSRALVNQHLPEGLVGSKPTHSRHGPPCPVGNQGPHDRQHRRACHQEVCRGH